MGLLPKFFPNAVTTPFFEISSEALSKMPLWEVAQHIQRVVRVDPADDVRKLADWVAALPDKSVIRHTFPFSQMSFITSGWHRFPLWTGSELDVFPALASPVFVATALVDGLVYFVESREEKGLDAFMSLDESLWEILDRDESFREL
jgi:Ni/Fe-hydrogenase subunit HybB-like protein